MSHERPISGGDGIDGERRRGRAGGLVPRMPPYGPTVGASDRRRLSRYDVLLTAVPLTLLAGWIAGFVAGLSTWVALMIGAVAAVPFLADGLAINPPQ